MHTNTHLSAVRMPSSSGYDGGVHGDVGGGRPKGHTFPSTANGSGRHELLLLDARLPVSIGDRAGVEWTVTKRAIARASQEDGRREGDTGHCGRRRCMLEGEMGEGLCRRKLVRGTHGGRRVEGAIDRERVRFLALGRKRRRKREREREREGGRKGGGRERGREGEGERGRERRRERGREIIIGWLWTTETLWHTKVLSLSLCLTHMHVCTYMHVCTHTQVISEAPTLTYTVRVCTCTWD